MAHAPSSVLTKLDALRAELGELAFALERRHRPDAADVANLLSDRLRELCDEIAANHPPAVPASVAIRSLPSDPILHN